MKNKSLTPREEEILSLVSSGMKRKDIAQKLWITIDTVNRHLLHAYQKLETNNRLEAVIKYERYYKRKQSQILSETVS